MQNDTSPHTLASGPLAGLRVVDLTTILLGPFATQILGDMGADVIKVEAPAGDPIRHVGPPPADTMGSVFLGANRNKRSVVMDLKRREVKELFYKMIEGADIFVHNMRPQAAARLEIDYASLQQHKSDLIYCSTYGFRAGGPYGHKPAFDDMIQAACGLASLQSQGHAPRYVTSAIADKITATTVVYAITMALVHRLRTGRGQHVEVPMFETLVAFNMVEHLYGAAYQPPRGEPGYPRALSPERRPYATQDGYIGVLPYTDDQWQSFFRIAGREDLANDERYGSLSKRLANIDALYGELAAIVAERTTASWLDALDDANVPSMAVLSPADLVEDAHLRAVDFWHQHVDPELGALRFAGIPTHFSDSPGSIHRMVPRLGEHTIEVLKELGVQEKEIFALLEDDALIQAAKR
ncbi:MAG: CoA transferase [Pseudomonadota bacterium]|nr:CoA transferase [Pseudomonadota bacterium]